MIKPYHTVRTADEVWENESGAVDDKPGPLDNAEKCTSGQQRENENGSNMSLT